MIPLRLLSNFLSVRNDLIVRSVKIKGTLEAVEPLHIGGEKSIYENYIEVVKGVDGTPYIPATSLKGVLRSLVEIEYSKLGVQVCPGSEIDLSHLYVDQELFQEVKARYGNYVNTKKLKVETCGKVYENIINGLSSQNEEKVSNYLKELEEKMCEACKIFGTTGFHGSLTVYDAMPLKVELATRPSLYVFKKKLFKIEYVKEGSTFSFMLSLRNPTNYMIGVLVLALKDLNEGKYRIGGLKSRGFGLVAFKNLSMEIMNSSEAFFSRKDGALVLKPLSANDVEVVVEGESMADPGFFQKVEPFVSALKKVFKGSVSYGQR